MPRRQGLDYSLLQPRRLGKHCPCRQHRKCLPGAVNAEEWWSDNEQANDTGPKGVQGHPPWGGPTFQAALGFNTLSFKSAKEKGYSIICYTSRARTFGMDVLKASLGREQETAAGCTGDLGARSLTVLAAGRGSAGGRGRQRRARLPQPSGAEHPAGGASQQPPALGKTSRSPPEECVFSAECSSFFSTWSFPPRVCEPSLEVHDLTCKTASLISHITQK